jgi:hypothetical protein
MNKIIILGLEERGVIAGNSAKLGFYQRLFGHLDGLGFELESLAFCRQNIERYPQAVTSSRLLRILRFVIDTCQMIPSWFTKFSIVKGCWKVSVARCPTLRSKIQLLLDFPSWYVTAQRFVANNSECRVICWNPYHAAGRLLCMQRSRFSDLLFMEYGMLPGHVICDKNGLNGESWVVRDPEYNYLNISEADRKCAQEYVNDVAMHRRANKVYDHEANTLIKSRFSVLVAGIELFGSGVKPNGTDTSQALSPVYRDNIELLEDVCRVVGHDVQVVYKGHPNMKAFESFDRLRYPKVVFAGDEEIHQLIKKVDVVVSISSVAQLSLIVGKPVVLVGKNPMWGKGCTIEVASREQLSHAIKCALSSGFTAQHQNAFIDYVARELKYVMYGCGETGRSIDQFIDDIRSGNLGRLMNN